MYGTRYLTKISISCFRLSFDILVGPGGWFPVFTNLLGFVYHILLYGGAIGIHKTAMYNRLLPFEKLEAMKDCHLPNKTDKV